MPHVFDEHRIMGGIAADAPFWAGLEEGEVRLPRCRGCGRWTWPAHHRCGVCGSWDADWHAVDPAGTVYSWTRSHYAFDRTAERAPSVPYVVVLGALPAADGARLLGVLDGPEEGLAIGAPVRARIDPPGPVSKGHAAVRWVLG